MTQISKIRREDTPEQVFSASMPYPRTNGSSVAISGRYSPSKSLHKLCALRGVQKLREELEEGENIGHAFAYRGFN